MHRSRFSILLVFGVLVAAGGAAGPAAGSPHASPGAPPAWTTADLFASPSPYALGHRGYGVNTGTDPARPVENTLAAFQRAFDEGIRVVELDLQLTADGKVVVFHDDFLADYTCVNSLTYDELLARVPEVPLFRTVLNVSRHYSRRDALGGLLFAEIKVPAPLCDDANTSAQAAVSESRLVAAVVAEIRQARMEGQVVLNAGSPTVLRHAQLQAPDIPRALSLNVLQLLTPEQVQQIVGMPVVPIPKDDFGLAWYNIGPVARLPRIPSFAQFVGLSLAVGSRAVSLDKLVLLQAGSGAPGIVAALHGAGIEAIAWTVDTPGEWAFLAAAGIDGVTTNDIAMGLALQAPLPSALLAGATDEAAARPVTDETRAAALGVERPLTGGTRGAVRIGFTLPDGRAARIGLFDVTGRVVESRDVGSLGAGRHEVTLGAGLSPGMYFVRLSHPAGLAQAKAAVVR